MFWAENIISNSFFAYTVTLLQHTLCTFKKKLFLTHNKRKPDDKEHTKPGTIT